MLYRGSLSGDAKPNAQRHSHDRFRSVIETEYQMRYQVDRKVEDSVREIYGPTIMRYVCARQYQRCCDRQPHQPIEGALVV